MREIKFRAWDPVFKVWLAKDFHLFGEVTCFQIVEQQLKPDDSGRGSLERMGDVQVSQFTGLKDRDGVEIYEGDVVDVYPFHKFHTKEKDRYQRVEFHAGSFDAELSSFGWEGEDLIELGECKVIGNIYEHPLMGRINLNKTT